jgi:hypothetical protein
VPGCRLDESLRLPGRGIRRVLSGGGFSFHCFLLITYNIFRGKHNPELRAWFARASVRPEAGPIGREKALSFDPASFVKAGRRCRRRSARRLRAGQQIHGIRNSCSVCGGTGTLVSTINHSGFRARPVGGSGQSFSREGPLHSFQLQWQQRKRPQRRHRNRGLRTAAAVTVQLAGFQLRRCRPKPPVSAFILVAPGVSWPSC